MELKNNTETKMTEEIMRAFSRHSKEAIVPMEVEQYNPVFSHVHRIVCKYLASDTTPKSDGGFINGRKLGET